MPKHVNLRKKARRSKAVLEQVWCPEVLGDKVRCYVPVLFI